MRRQVSEPSLILVVALSLMALALPPAVAACSCAVITMDDARTQPEAVVFSGVTEPRDGRGYPVTVTRWFKGGGIIEPRAWLHPGGFNLTGGGADCSIPPLPIGFEYIFIAYPFEGMYSVGLCSPHAAVATPEGQVMVADAARVFGGGALPSTGPPETAPPEAPSADPAIPAGARAPGLTVDAALASAIVVVAALGIVVGAIATRRRLGGREP